MELATDGGAADVVVALEHRHTQPRPREVTGRHQAVVTRADDDDVTRAQG